MTEPRVTLPARRYAELLHAAERATTLIDTLTEIHIVEEPGTYLEGRCAGCGHLYPCDTIRVLDGGN